ncbi:MAG: AAA family ATPase [bacterium]|nr:AAA family ATPase [bacterium]
MPDKKIIIGVTGTHASGKDTVAEHICKKYNLKSYSTSDEVRYEATSIGVDHSRASMFKLANKIRGEFGPGELAMRALARINRDEIVALVTGIRNIGEIEYLKKHANFHLISVDGPIEVRYERAHKRMRAGEQMKTFEEFREGEEKEMNQSDLGQQLIPCMRAADYFIVNDGSLEELEQRTDEVIKAILPTLG